MNRPVVAALTVALLAASPLVPAAEIPFEPKIVSSDFPGGRSLRIGDLDGDGDADLITTQITGATEWWENDGTPNPGWIRRTIGASSVSTSVVDVDSDGDLDVFASSTPFVTWFDNDGSSPPSFTERTIEFLTGGRSIVPADLNRDGHVDAVLTEAGGTVRWYENDGASPPGWTVRVIDPALTDPGWAETGDFNGDGHMDVVAITISTEQLVWYESDGAAVPGFTKRTIDSMGTNGWQCKTGDFDGDGDLDIVVSQPGPARDIAWYENDGAAVPGWTARIIDDNGAIAPQDLYTVDFDSDGDLDVVSASTPDDKIRWHENLGGSPPAWTNRTITTASAVPNDIAVDDLDGDGDVDLAAASNGDNKLAIYENRTIHRNATLPGQTIIDTIAVFFDLSITIADLDGDGDGDVVSGANATTWHENLDGAGTSWQSATIMTHFNRAGDSTVADLDLDGDLDVLACDIQTGQIDWADNTAGDGSAWTVNTIPHLGAECYSVAVEDIDGDGDPEVVTTMVSDRVSWHENTAGDASAWSEHLIDTHIFNLDALPMDVDRDGDIDVVNTTTTGAVWYENTSGDGSTWSAAQPVGLLSGSRLTLAQGDLDRDGDLDVLLASEDADTIEWYENTAGDGSAWSEHLISDSVDGVLRIAVHDMDADGDLDVISPSSATDRIVFHENAAGDGSVWKETLISLLADSPWAVAVGDIDRDGKPDVAANSTGDAELAWYRNRGGQFGFTGADAGSDVAFEGEAAAVVDIVTRVNGRTGDSLGRLTTVQLEFRDADGGSTLSSAQANALIENLRIYRDADGSGTFDAGVDTLVQTVASLSLTAGVQTVTLPASGPNGLVAAPVSFFVVAEMAADASSQAVNTLAIAHLSQSGPSTAVDASAGISLAQEFSPDFQGQTLTIAPTFVVSSTADAVDAAPGDGVCATAGAVCTLRAAVQEANAGSADRRIFVPAGTYTLTIPGAFEDAAATGDLDVVAGTGTIAIVGAGAAVSVVDGAGLDRVFHAVSGEVHFERLTITGGNATGGGSSNWGGGIQVNSVVTARIRDCDIVGNEANAGGGGLGNDFIAQTSVFNSLFRANTTAAGFGEAIENLGTLDLFNSTISGHTVRTMAIDNQSDVNSVMSLTSCTVTNNYQGIQNLSSTPVTLTNTVVANQAGSGFATNDDVTGGSFTSGGHNLIGEFGGSGMTNGVNGDQVGALPSPIDGGLRPLGQNGGPTLTHALKPTSPAIDAGSCGILSKDQRGEDRPVDIPGVANVDDGCDIGAFEAKLGQTQAPLSVPVRWCGVNGAPSIDDPTILMDGDTTADQVLRKRHEKIADEIYLDQANVSFVSAANAQVSSFPLIDDPQCASGCATLGPGGEGDVLVDPDTLDFKEFDELIAKCREAWHTLDPKIQGITGVQIGRFVNDAGTPIGILGIGGRPAENDASEQVVAGRVMVVDRLYRLDLPGNPSPPNPEDLLDQLLGHEMGHALSLRHGDGVDNDNDGILDNDDEKAVGLPQLDGVNLMQYRNGTKLTSAQGAQIRNQASVTIPDVVVQSLTDGIPDAQPIPKSTVDVLEHGFGGLSGVDVENAIVRKFQNAIVRKFENAIVRKFQNAIVRKFQNAIVRKFENADIPHFGMAFTGTTPTDSAIPHAATGTLPWPAPIEYRTFYHAYLDLDSNDATGAYPADKANPSDAGNNFPGINNFQNMPDLTEEAGIDLISQIELFATCSANSCDTFSELRVFDYNDGTGEYEQVLFENDTDITARGLGLYQRLDSEYVESDDVPAGVTLQPRIPVSLLTAAGLSFQGGRPNPIRMEVVASIECDGNVINGDPSSAPVDCSCNDCASCPDYPGCVAGVGTPQALNGTRIVTDCATGVMTFEPPRLPRCAVSPGLAASGQSVTAYFTQLPTTLAGQTVQVVLGAAVLGSAPAGSIDSSGSLSVPVTLPAGATGSVRLTGKITGSAVSLDCPVAVTPAPACTDTDGDGECDAEDADDDNDGVLDGADPAPLNPLSCGSADADVCDDCSSGVNDPANDGPDADLDGICDVSDTDDDNDGVADGADCAPLDPTVSAIPGEVGGLEFLSQARITWNGPLPGDGGGTRVQVLRGSVAQLPVGAGAETCLGSTAASSLNDNTNPPSGTSHWYLSRRTNVCGAGTYGVDSSAAERISTVCP